MERALDRLQQRDMVAEQPTSTMAGEPEYRFRHVLVRDVCYQRLPRAERVPGTSAPPTGWTPSSPSRASDLAEVLANHRWTAHEIARTLGLDPTPYALAARTALHQAARRAYELHALENAATLVGRALGLGGDPDHRCAGAVRRRAGLLPRRRRVPGRGGAEGLTELAERCRRGGPAGAARAWTLLGHAAWSRADRAGRCAAWTGPSGSMRSCRKPGEGGGAAGAGPGRG